MAPSSRSDGRRDRSDSGSVKIPYLPCADLAFSAGFRHCEAGQVNEGEILWQSCDGLVPQQFCGWEHRRYVCSRAREGVLRERRPRSDKLGLSLELGPFVAGVMISTTDFSQHTLEQVEAIRNLFADLFLARIGMLIHVQFLWIHVDILLASVILVVIVKTVVITTVVKAFGYNIRTSSLVGLSLAQIGEFAFVLLSRASNLHVVEVTTALMFKIIPAVMHLGNLMRWFPAESNNQNEGESYHTGTTQRGAL